MLSQRTTAHQDHVIAHVLGATVLGHFVFDETLYLILDIGFIWRIYLDGEMDLLPGTLAIQESEADERLKQKLKRDVELLLSQNFPGVETQEITRVPFECLIEEVAFFHDDDKRRLVLHADDNDLVIESCLQMREFKITHEGGPTNEKRRDK